MKLGTFVVAHQRNPTNTAHVSRFFGNYAIDVSPFESLDTLGKGLKRFGMN